MKMHRSILAPLVAAWTCLIMPAAAHAYIGPGAGLSAIGSLLALIAAIAVAIFGFLWYPIKSYRRKRRQAAESARAAGPADRAGPSAEK